MENVPTKLEKKNDPQQKNSGNKVNIELCESDQTFH